MSLSNKKAKSRIFRTLYQVEQPLESIPQVDMVDRSGYMPVDLQYSRMMLAGRKREDIMNYEHNLDYQTLLSKLESGETTIEKLLDKNIIDKNMSKTELADILREKITDISNWRKEYQKNMQEFHRLEYEKQIRQDAINSYKAQLDEERARSQKISE